ncbi:UDP-N-acetylmuramoyl-tripeptide--D-alanyl-D-alanine ligase [Marispirochaeta sp.]|uniref:UDP-N-acetylmuramoyl-tripeptide--D-alanyl-D- alanine ligase n=1 Tax=Marispirochaeta sp. TaxID=2038653 RepID=UPI0029C6669E|nr:UDP-N-acetylmuramoyl-tripeptide--D-alanyl-D-alanine ligase [Marispirochaeta sp.]
MTDSLFTLENAVDAVSGRFVGPFCSTPVSGVSIDTRSLNPGDLFVALPGEKSDGHAYLSAAFAAGAAGALVDLAKWELLPLKIREAGHCILVENPLNSLQDLARWYLDKFPSVLKIAITGSNGKTTTKELLASVLENHRPTYASAGNFNSEIGLPLSVFGLTKEHLFGVFEFGTNRRGEISLLSSILKPNIALVTNVGSAHIGMFGSREAIADEKGDIFSSFDSLSRGLMQENEAFARRMMAGKRGNFSYFGPGSTPGVEAVEDRGLEGSIIRFNGHNIHLHLPGEHNILNACAAISAARLCGADDAAIHRGIEAVKPSFGRSELIPGEVSVFQDCYNSNPESLKAGLAVIRNCGWTQGRRIGVFGSMKELGELEKKLHEESGRICAQSGFDAWFFLGAEARYAYSAYTAAGGPSGFWSAEETKLKADLLEYVHPGDLVYLKGARSMGLERIAASLQEGSGRRQVC